MVHVAGWPRTGTRSSHAEGLRVVAGPMLRLLAMRRILLGGMAMRASCESRSALGGIRTTLAGQGRIAAARAASSVVATAALGGVFDTRRRPAMGVGPVVGVGGVFGVAAAEGRGVVGWAIAAAAGEGAVGIVEAAVAARCWFALSRAARAGEEAVGIVEAAVTARCWFASRAARILDIPVGAGVVFGGNWRR